MNYKKMLEDAKEQARNVQGYLESCDRNHSELLLMADDVDNGTYIIRPRQNPETKHLLTLSVRDRHWVVHFAINVEKHANGMLTFYIATNSKNSYRSSLRDLLECHQTFALSGEVKTDSNEIKPIECRLTVPFDSQGLCDCGLPLNITELPKGWSVHKAHTKDQRNGLLYFKDPKGGTSWQLDPEIDQECQTSDYLKFGQLNGVNFKTYHVDYVSTSSILQQLGLKTG